MSIHAIGAFLRPAPGPERKPPRLVKGRRRGKKRFWKIRHDGQKEISTRCVVGKDDEKAERKFLEFLLSRSIKCQADDDWRRIKIEALLRDHATAIEPTKATPPKQREYLQSRLRRTKKLIEFFGETKLGEFGIASGNAYIAWRTSQQIATQSSEVAPDALRRVSPNEAVKDLRELRRVFRVAAQHHHIPEPVVMPLRAEEKDLRIGLTRKQVAQLLCACRGRVWDYERNGWRRETIADDASGLRIFGRLDLVPRSPALARFVLIGVGTGTRHAALRRLRWNRHATDGSPDLKRGILHRKGTGARETTKRRSPVLLPRMLRAHLRRWHRADSAAKIDFIIHTRRGRRYQVGLFKQFEALVHRAGLNHRLNKAIEGNITAHNLRHTIAHWLLDSGASEISVADFLGCTVETLARYYGSRAINGHIAVVDCINDLKEMIPAAPDEDDDVD
ncbi:tyrosine-type recombinase/integrase [Methylobacterium segetis]|uniref:tyrosine-type recombinase/integrase n=1 Tax=Methylobacterium segetis TaxID=2488750 RepID=UPI00104CB179|nr:tyrosine-type recombinase/integrase [Methylobacterium segetis]